MEQKDTKSSRNGLYNYNANITQPFQLGDLLASLLAKPASSAHVAGADPGLILECCKILQKKWNKEMRQYAEKLQIQQEARSYSFDYSRGTDLKVKFDSKKKHPPIWGAKSRPAPSFPKLCQHQSQMVMDSSKKSLSLQHYLSWFQMM